MDSRGELQRISMRARERVHGYWLACSSLSSAGGGSMYRPVMMGIMCGVVSFLNKESSGSGNRKSTIPHVSAKKRPTRDNNQEKKTDRRLIPSKSAPSTSTQTILNSASTFEVVECLRAQSNVFVRSTNQSTSSGQVPNLGSCYFRPVP